MACLPACICIDDDADVITKQTICLMSATKLAVAPVPPPSRLVLQQQQAT
jgi:hypothetical protein